MMNLARPLMVLLLGLMLGGGILLTFGSTLAADKSSSIDDYFPPSESAGGWRRCRNDDEVRRMGMDPKQLTRVGNVNLTFYGGPWQIVVIRHGYLVKEWMGANAMPQTTFDLWSSTKSATGIAYGLLLDDSRHHRLPRDAQVDLDSTAYSFIPEGYPLTDPAKEKIKLRHLLSMTSGIPGEDHGIEGFEVNEGGGEYEIALGHQTNRFGESAARLYAAPGDAWDYSDAGFAHLSLIFYHVMGQEIGDVMRERVFRPIGITNGAWDYQGGGGNLGPHTNAHSGLHLSARDFARLGYLLLHGGVWEGKSIIPKWWLDLATRSSQSVNPDYGFTFWVNTAGTLWPSAPKDAFAMMGFASNRCYVVPSLDLVVARTGWDPQPIGPVGDPLVGILGALVK